MRLKNMCNISRYRKIIGIIGGVILIGLIIKDRYDSKYSLTVTNYHLQSNFSSSLRILQLTDLHNSEFGAQNSRLVSAVRAQSPDLILLTGDLLNSNEQRTDVATDLITQLCDIAPVYCSNGNHEIEYQENYGVDVDELYR